MLYAWGKRAYILTFLPFDTYIFTLLTSVFRDGGKVTSARAKLLPGCHSSVLNLTTQEKNPSTTYTDILGTLGRGDVMCHIMLLCTNEQSQPKHVAKLYKKVRSC